MKRPRGCRSLCSLTTVSITIPWIPWRLTPGTRTRRRQVTSFQLECPALTCIWLLFACPVPFLLRVCLRHRLLLCVLIWYYFVRGRHRTDSGPGSGCETTRHVRRMALVGEANGEPSGLQTSRMAVGAAANGEPRGFKYVIIYFLSKMETEMCFPEMCPYIAQPFCVSFLQRRSGTAVRRWHLALLALQELRSAM